MLLKSINSKQKDSEINAAPLCFSKDFPADMKKSRFCEYLYHILVDYYSICVEDTLGIQKYLMIKNNVK